MTFKNLKELDTSDSRSCALVFNFNKQQKKLASSICIVLMSIIYNYIRIDNKKRFIY